LTSRWVGLLLALSAACVDHDDGLVVVVDQSHRGGRQFVTDRGYGVTLTRAYVVVRTVQLVPCDTAQAFGRRLRDFFVLERSAFAHSTGVPDYIGVASVDDLMLADGTTSDIGVMQVLDRDHCAVNVLLGPAPESALHLPGDSSMVGRTLHLEGSYRPPGGGDDKPLLIETGEALPRLVPMSRLSLASGRAAAQLTVVHFGYERWLDGLDLDTIDAKAAAAAVLRRAVAGLQVEVR
jgi:hypothetical protein